MAVAETFLKRGKGSGRDVQKRPIAAALALNVHYAPIIKRDVQLADSAWLGAPSEHG